MRKTFVLLTSVAALGVLAGCGTTYDYDGLRTVEATGDGFAPALAREYKSFALYETDEMMDWVDAAHFGRKAETAAEGRTPTPERVEDWDLSPTHVQELTGARARLVTALDKGAPQRWPQEAAAAQVSYDCWIEQQEENWQTEHIAQCRERFHNAMAALEQRFAEAEQPTDLQPAMAAEPTRPTEAMPPPAAMPAREFVVPFAFDSAQLPPEADATVEAVAEIAKSRDDIQVFLGGHADRAGPAQYNDRLSKDRAEALNKALVDRGVPAEKIAVRAYGEDRPVVPTGDGVAEQQNRRVEIEVETASTAATR